MDSKDIKNLFEAYNAVYDEDLRDEIEYASIDEDLSFVDDLSDNELIQVMEEIFDETEITLDECLNSLGFFLSEAVVTRGGQKARARRAETSTARITSSADRRAGKTSERQQKVRIGRLAQAAQTAAEYPGKQARRAATAVAGGARAAAARAKTLAGGAASAAAGGAAEAGRKVQSAKEKVKGFLGKVGRAAKAGYRAASKEFSGQAAREAQGRSDLRSTNRTLRRQARERRGRDTSEFGEEYELDEAMSSYDRNRQRAAQRAAARNEARKSGKTGIVPGVGYVSQRPEKETWTDQAGRERHKTGARMSSLKTQSEDYDLYDLILSHLLDEGYAETIEDAEVIMVNMSEDWRDAIIEDFEQLDEIDIRSITRGGKTIYRKSPKEDRASTEARRSAGKEKHPNPYQLPYHGPAKHDPRTKEIKRNIEKLNAPRALKPGEERDPYRTVKTDQRARRERASGR